jgi:hypothetical protein
MEDTDRAKFSDVELEALRLLQAVRISRHHVTLDAEMRPVISYTIVDSRAQRCGRAIALSSLLSAAKKAASAN